MGHIESESLDLNGHSAIDELPGEIYQTALKEIIKKNFASPLADCTVKIDAASAKGDNYIGVLYRVTVKDPQGNELSVVIKLPPQNAARREQFFARPCFLRESQFYETIYPLYKSFQEEKGIDVETEGFYQIPLCYKSITEDGYEGLFLEDLKVTGFEMFDRFKETTELHVNHVMRTVGKFHAISLAMKDQKPELMEEYKELQDIFFQRDDNSKQQIKIWFDMLKKQAIDVLNTNENEDLKQKAEKVLEADFFELLMSCINGKDAEPYTVLSHGDCWNNNVMFKNENGIPVEVRLLDWQIMRYASPVCDLMYYIFGCTTKNLRDKHYNDFLNVYYESLSSFLKRLGSNPEEVFPRIALDDQLKKFGKFGLAMAIMVLPIFTSQADDIPDMDAMAEKMKESLENGTEVSMDSMQFSSEKTIGVYNERMSGVFQDMYDLGYI